MESKTRIQKLEKKTSKVIPTKPLVQKVKQKLVKAFQHTELTKDEQVTLL